MQDCLFCKIVSGEIAAEIVFRDDHVLAFRDINPQSPVHLIIIPLKHIQSVVSINTDDFDLMGHLFFAVKEIAERLSLADGFRLVVNCGRNAGQEIQHIHIHMLGGRAMGWPPG